MPDKLLCQSNHSTRLLCCICTYGAVCPCQRCRGCPYETLRGKTNIMLIFWNILLTPFFMKELFSLNSLNFITPFFSIHFSQLSPSALLEEYYFNTIYKADIPQLYFYKPQSSMTSCTMFLGLCVFENFRDHCFYQISCSL